MEVSLTTKGLATKRRIVEGAAAYLRQIDHGEMTLDDVRAATSTSKSQLFHYFPNGKEELLLEVMRFEADRVIGDQQPQLSELSSWDAWESWRRILVARYRAQGSHCPMNSLVMQIGNTHGADEVTRALLNQWQNHLRLGIDSMKRNGLINSTVDAESAASAIVAGVQGGVVVMWSTGNTDHLEAVLDLLFDSLRRRGGDRVAIPGDSRGPYR